MTTDDDRIAYLAGEGESAGALDDHERQELDDLRELLADSATWVAPPVGLEDAVVAAIAAETSAAGPRFSPPRAPARSARRGWARPGYLVGAAAAAAAIVVAVVLITPDDPPASQQLAATLTSTELAPGAEGAATFTKTSSGWRIELDATGLPRRDDGRFYQAWLKGDDDVLVAIGSFNEGEDVVLWAGVSPIDHPTITITEETDDGDPTSSGQRVLVGSITSP
jgi:Anti-sigma-K factor rskA